MNNAVPAECYESAIDDRTLIVPLTQVSFVNGYRADVERIKKIAHENGPLLFLDGYQDCGTRPLDVKALGVDFFVTGTLKYLMGPPGIGISVCPPGTDREANADHDELDGAARNLRVQRPSVWTRRLMRGGSKAARRPSRISMRPGLRFSS